MEPKVSDSFVTMKPTGTTLSLGTAKPTTKSNQNTYPALNNYLRSLRTVRSGKFEMGSSSGPADERPIHEVTLTTFRMGSTPVPVAVWKEYCNANGLQLPVAPRWGWIEDHPIVTVSWDDIMGSAGNLGFCSWVSNVAGLLVKLPTEAEFEFALRGGHDTQTFPWGQSFDPSKVWCSSKQTKRSTAPVTRGSNFFTNRFGLTDLAGNVSEWCFDAYMPYNRAPLNNPAAHFGYSVDRCFRGGSWKESASNAFRCSRRMFSYQGNKSDEIGFRLVTQ